MKRAALIMAGGAGERFWPVSRQRKPKQLLNLVSEKMMIEEAIDRVEGIIDVKDIFIITNELLQEHIRIALPSLPPENIIAEPAKRNTAPCLALGAGFLQAHYGLSNEEISVAVLTADHVMKPVEKFRESVELAMDFAEKGDSIVVFGIQPNRAETGYGYIELGSGDEEIVKVVSFKEKPNTETAEEYLRKGNYLWNSGMFFYRLDTFINEMTKSLPEVGNRISDLKDKYNGKTQTQFVGSNPDVKELFASFPDISIDYGLIERSQVIYCCKARFDWDDIGSWDSLERVLDSGLDGNVSYGDNLFIETNNVIVMDFAKQHKHISVVGMEDVIVIHTDDAILVCPKSKAQDVKKIVESHKKNQRLDLL